MMKRNPRTDSQMKKVLEYGPLLLFFIVNAVWGIYPATAALVVTSIGVLAYLWITERRVPLILAFGSAMVVLFGGLTLVFADEVFIKIKPTIVSLFIAGVLLIGTLIGRNPVKMMMGNAMKLDERQWKYLTVIWIVMFITVAIANEWAWRNLSTDAWVSFKVFGLTGISLFFGVVMAIFLSRRRG